MNLFSIVGGNISFSKGFLNHHLGDSLTNPFGSSMVHVY